ncbi:unnamed protein product [Penicillium olsonii]|nr:unnamed protein product [Penicillium olsonii]
MENFRPRKYQIEMFEMSMRENIIAVVSFLSSSEGNSVTTKLIHTDADWEWKDLHVRRILLLAFSEIITTFRAGMRIMAELERCHSNQIVWFLVPTKVLCGQQFTCLSRDLPAVSMRTLTGEDRVEWWSSQGIWDAALLGIKVVFSTHAVLADALTHGFVQLSRLALLIFDEAHHCMKSHPGNRIMHDFYKRAKKEKGVGALPSILGLTASVDPAKVRCLEENLDATCRAPLAERQELSEHGSQTKLTKIVYSQIPDSADPPPFLKNLDEVVMGLRERSKSQELLANETVKFSMKARMTWYQLGIWASGFFLTEMLRQIACKRTAQETEPSRGSAVDEFSIFLKRQAITEVNVHLMEPGNISNKVERLLLFLKQRAGANFSGIVFVRERTTAYILSILINTHPATHGIVRCAPCVSNSNRREPWAVYGSMTSKSSEKVVDELRCGKINLIVATNVLEEGIDLPACRLVISFEIPDTLTSYIQRRGRARQRVSEFVVMEEEHKAPSASRQWKRLENMVQDICLDHTRCRQEFEVENGLPEKRTLQCSLDTGALLTAENALPHLYHFCATLRSEMLDEKTPSFSCQRNPDGQFLSTVYLPSGIDSSVRVAKGHHWWATKKSALQDAAFQAVCALHSQGLVNDHFLPLSDDDFRPGSRERKDSTAKLPSVENFISFWNDMQSQFPERKMYRCCIEILENTEPRPALAMALFTSVKLPISANVDLYWDDQTTFTARLQPLNQAVVLSQALCHIIQKITAVLLHSTRGRSAPGKYADFLPCFTPDLPLEELEDWLKTYDGSFSAEKGQNQTHLLSPDGFVRSPALHFVPHVFRRWNRDPDTKSLSIECRQFDRRRNLIQRATLARHITLQESQRTVCIPAAQCTVDLLPWELSRASLLIPPMIQLIHRHLMAQTLRDRVFKDAPEICLDTLAEAITTPASQWAVNYQRLEFLGDALLKFIVATDLFQRHPHWHEGYLSKQKDLLVSNERLTQAAMTAHLEKYICNDFITRKHRAFSRKEEHESDQVIPKKVYADVVEALVAVAYKHGGVALSRKLVGIFLPELSHITPMQKELPKQNGRFSSHLDMKLDNIVGYRFTNRSLIWEALTHPSWQRDQSTSSYQRLEFLGDAVLDVLVTRMLDSQSPELTEGRMTELRAALVNADFLAFLCMDSAISEPIHATASTGSPEALIRTNNIALWMLMRHDNPKIVELQTECAKRYCMYGGVVKRKLDANDSYPWGALAQLGAPKFYSDLVESTLGAIFIESKGCLDKCERFLERIRLVDYLQRFVRHNVPLEHPKSALNRMTGSDKAEFEVQETVDGLRSISVWLKGKRIAFVDRCLSRTEAAVRGADEAVVSLRLQTQNQ